MNYTRVSVHGGHSGQFCNHAEDTLEEVILAYIEQGFSWVGITEHIPPVDDRFLYPEEKKAGLSAVTMLERFGHYMGECRRLQQKYQDKIQIFASCEIETYSGSEGHVADLIHKFQPDYIVGSVHHVKDIPIDYSKEMYDCAVSACGGIEALYVWYFDQQYEMIQHLTPAVVGHFDLIRIFDSSYRTRLLVPEIWGRMVRNLELVKNLDLTLDYNIRSLKKGAEEPYISEEILAFVREEGIKIAPGDDSHGVADIGIFLDDAVESLYRKGFSCDWERPRLYTW